MSFCHACGQRVEPQWNACPHCSTMLPSSGQEVQQPDIPHYSTQPSYQTHTQTIPQQQYQVPQNQYVSTQFTSSGGGGGGRVIAIIAVIAVVGIILAGVLYVWASSLASSPYTWSGEVDSRATGVKWYDSEGEWELDTPDGDVQMSAETLQLMEDNQITSAHVEYDWPYATIEYESDGSDWSNMKIEARMQINGDVWFTLMTSVTLDGDYTSIDDGECIAAIHEDAYYGSSSWRSEVGNTAWPYFCDSVDDY